MDDNKTQIEEDKKELILEIATKLFLQKGYEGSTLAEIARLAGLGHSSSLYSYFESKDQLYCLVVERMILNFQNPETKYKSSAPTLLGFVEDYVSSVEVTMSKAHSNGLTSAGYFSFVQEISMRMPELGHQIVELIEKYEVDLWTTQINAAKITGEVRKDVDAEEVAFLLRESYMGYSFCRTMEGGLTVDQARAFLMRWYERIKSNPKN